MDGGGTVLAVLDMDGKMLSQPHDLGNPPA